MQQESHYVTEAPASTLNTSSVVHSLMRFLWLLKRRKTVLMVSMIVSVTLGALYFATATRTFRARAAVLVRITRPDSASVTQSIDRSTQDQMATYERLVTSTVVLERTLDLLTESPPELLREMTHEQMLGRLSKMIRASAIRRTSIIEIAADSREPDAAWNVANAAVTAYLEYIDENHKSVTAEIINLLQQERQQLEERLVVKENELLEAKRGCADFGIDGASNVVHPTIQNVITLNSSLLETRARRIQLEASLTALRSTIKSKGDLQQHLLFLEPLLGKELMLNALGMNSHDVIVLGRIEQELLDNQAEFASLQQHYGPNHPLVIETASKIRTAQNYVNAFQTRQNDRMSGVQDERLGVMLLQMVEEDLARTWTQETEISKQYALAQAEANTVTDRLSAVQIVDRNVQTLRNLHDALVSRIETIDINENQSDVRVSIVDPPVRPDEPISPRIQHVGLIALLMGFLVGALVIYATDVMDDRFRSPEELQEQLGSPVLAMVRKHEQREGDRH